MRTPQPKSNPAIIQEITGKPASLFKHGFGNFILPGAGTATLTISGDLLHAVIENPLNKQETWIRIQHIDSIEITQSPIWEILVIGGGLLLASLPLIKQGAWLGFPLAGLGAIAIGAFFVFKHRYLCIHSQRHSVLLGLTKPPQIYQQFALNVMTLARQLNTPRVVTPSPTETTQGRTTTGVQTAGRKPQNTAGSSHTMGRVAPQHGQTVGHPKTQVQ